MLKQNPDQLDCIYIKRDADKLIRVNTEIQYGQAVFNTAYSMFPEASNCLRGTKYDCFFDDSKVDLFLLELQTVKV